MIRSTWAELEVRHFVRLERGSRSGEIPRVWPLREDGSGEQYTRPKGQGDDTYRRVPEKFWELLVPDPELTGAGLVMYLIAVRTSLIVGRADDLTFPRTYVTQTYGVGESTRKAGLRNLSSLLVLDPHTRVTDDAGGYLSRRRLRTVYDLDATFRAPAPTEAPPLAPTTSSLLPASSPYDIDPDDVPF